MLSNYLHNLLSSIKKNKFGLTLIELVVTIAVIAIASTILLSSYTTAMEKQRMAADMVTLSSIDTNLKQILLQDNIFDQLKMSSCLGGDDNTMSLIFVIKTDSKGRGYVDLTVTKVYDSGRLLKDECKTLYDQLIMYVGDNGEPTIYLSSASYKVGTYQVDIEFGKTTVSALRGPEINNDVIIITNSGDEHLARRN